jgi:tripartite-type tricarboxylate transporter receptor subunit TctC
MQKIIRILAATLTGAAAAAVPASAQAPAPFYQGKNVTMLIGFGPGGGNDIWARMVARHMVRHIPGNPTIIAQNLPGGGGLLVANQLYNVSPKDGTVIALINRGIPMEPLLGGAGTKFDPLKFNWLGSPDQDTAICTSRTDSGVTSMKQLFEKELVMGATGSGADSAIYPEFMGLLLGMKFKVVKGYKGSNEVRLAMERGEVQGICGSNDSVMNSDIARKGLVTILFQARLDPDPRMKSVPLGAAGARTADERQILELFFLRAALGRPFVAPPEVPADRISILRRAFDATMKDPVFVAEAKKQKFSVEPMTGEELASRIKRAYDSPKDIVKRTADVLGRVSQAEKKKK